MSDNAKCDVKSKLKLTTTSLQNATMKKAGRGAQSKSAMSNGLGDRETSNASNRSAAAADDVNSSTENTADRTSEEEEDDESDYSNSSPSDVDNDRDSDLDFSVNDCHSRRAKKINKRKIQAKRLANKKRRRSTVDFTGSDDGSTPNRKKAAKLPKKSLNNSAKSYANATTAAVSSTVKSPAATSTPRITKITYAKESPQSTSHDNPNSNASTQKASNPTTPLAAAATATINETKSKSIIIVKQKEKKANTGNVVLGDTSSLFAPDVIKKNAIDNTNVTKHVGQVSTSMATATATVTVTPKVEIAKRTTPVTIHGLVPHQNAPKLINTGTRLIKAPFVTFRKLPKPVINLASEQDKQLDLIDSLVQEELSKSEIETPTSSTNSQTVIPAAIPNIVKMLETSEASTSIGQSSEMPQQNSTSAANMSIAYTTTQSVHDQQMLPDDLLESFVNSDYLPDDLMQHVAKLVEDKNVQQVIDQQVLGVSSMSSCTVLAPPIQTVSTSQNLNVVSASSSAAIKSNEDSKTIVSIAKPSTVTILNAFQTPGKEPIKVKRSDGSIITLPPIEAPTTRGAKRRATEITPASDLQQHQQQQPPPKQKLITVILQTESPTPQKSLTNSPQPPQIKSPPGSLLAKPKPILVRERRASVAVKRVSIDAKPKRSMSISAPPPADAGAGAGAGAGADDDDDDEEDGSDGTANSEDDPHR